MRHMNKHELNIKVFGTKTPGHQFVVTALEKYLSEAQIDHDIQEVTDVSAFLEAGIESIPAIKANDALFNLQHNGSFNKSLRHSLKEILKMKNFGTMKKVIIPIDFSNSSTNAFVYGHRIATEINAVTLGLHVYYPSSKELTAATKSESGFTEERRQKLKNFIAQFDKDWGSDLLVEGLIDQEFRMGFPGEEILESAKANQPGLIIMGATGATNNIKKWFGSVSTKVMNEAECPVLLIPRNATYKEIKKVAYAYDDPNLDQKVFESLGNFCNDLGAELHLIHIDDEAKIDGGMRLKQLFNETYPDLAVSLSAINSSDVIEGLDHFTENNQISILAMATKSRTFVEDLFHYSMTKEMAIKSKVPLLILK